jgi:hypothetical protein
VALEYLIKDVKNQGYLENSEMVSKTRYIGCGEY